jgi:hypothetical protein
MLVTVEQILNLIIVAPKSFRYPTYHFKISFKPLFSAPFQLQQKNRQSLAILPRETNRKGLLVIKLEQNRARIVKPLSFYKG